MSKLKGSFTFILPDGKKNVLRMIDRPETLEDLRNVILEISPVSNDPRSFSIGLLEIYDPAEEFWVTTASESDFELVLEDLDLNTPATRMKVRVQLVEDTDNVAELPNTTLPDTTLPDTTDTELFREFGLGMNFSHVPGPELELDMSNLHGHDMGGMDSMIDFSAIDSFPTMPPAPPGIIPDEPEMPDLPPGLDLMAAPMLGEMDELQLEPMVPMMPSPPLPVRPEVVEEEAAEPAEVTPEPTPEPTTQPAAPAPAPAPVPVQTLGAPAQPGSPGQTTIGAVRFLSRERAGGVHVAMFTCTTSPLPSTGAIGPYSTEPETWYTAFATVPSAVAPALSLGVLCSLSVTPMAGLPYASKAELVEVLGRPEAGEAETIVFVMPNAKGHQRDDTDATRFYLRRPITLDGLPGINGVSVPDSIPPGSLVSAQVRRIGRDGYGSTVGSYNHREPVVLWKLADMDGVKFEGVVVDVGKEDRQRVHYIVTGSVGPRSGPTVVSFRSDDKQFDVGARLSYQVHGRHFFIRESGEVYHIVHHVQLVKPKKAKPVKQTQPAKPAPAKHQHRQATFDPPRRACLRITDKGVHRGIVVHCAVGLGLAFIRTTTADGPVIVMWRGPTVAATAEALQVSDLTSLAVAFEVAPVPSARPNPAGFVSGQLYSVKADVHPLAWVVLPRESITTCIVRGLSSQHADIVLPNGLGTTYPIAQISSPLPIKPGDILKLQTDSEGAIDTAEFDSALPIVEGQTTAVEGVVAAVETIHEDQPPVAFIVPVTPLVIERMHCTLVCGTIAEQLYPGDVVLTNIKKGNPLTLNVRGMRETAMMAFNICLIRSRIGKSGRTDRVLDSAAFQGWAPGSTCPKDARDLPGSQQSVVEFERPEVCGFLDRYPSLDFVDGQFIPEEKVDDKYTIPFVMSRQICKHVHPMTPGWTVHHLRYFFANSLGPKAMLMRPTKGKSVDSQGFPSEDTSFRVALGFCYVHHKLQAQFTARPALSYGLYRSLAPWTPGTGLPSWFTEPMTFTKAKSELRQESRSLHKRLMGSRPLSDRPDPNVGLYYITVPRLPVLKDMYVATEAIPDDLKTALSNLSLPMVRAYLPRHREPAELRGGKGRWCVVLDRQHHSVRVDIDAAQLNRREESTPVTPRYAQDLVVTDTYDGYACDDPGAPGWVYRNGVWPSMLMVGPDAEIKLMRARPIKDTKAPWAQ
ncbi:hypothetical protein J8273_6991 [Carpediemonas membranifera]|uniref:Uncharacterized protein n=1 Tax=Carpediemonas membranifera TaxID=201153 RepID=A0A8J6AXE4_9EUKA|nr:hypothetical protein J8273_6991 [Carpediemonas membranifera]|eukprot:KAG9390738.1 hypothetical protein J8273_6991 [Carpediemonas membranifera]